FPPSQPRPPKRGRGWMIFAIILLLLLSLSVLMNFGQLVGGATRVRGGGTIAGGREVGPRLEEAVIEDNSAPNNKIAIVEVTGIITGQALNQQGITMVDVIKAQLERAQEDRRVKAVILKVDSPGGEVLASDEISQAIKDFQDGKKGHGDDEETTQ